MAKIINAALDATPTYVRTNTTQFWIASAIPTSYTHLTDTVGLGKKDSPTIGTIADTTDGRKMTIAAFGGGATTKSGTAAYYVLTSNTDIIAVQSLTETKQVLADNEFKLTEPVDMSIVVDQT